SIVPLPTMSVSVTPAAANSTTTLPSVTTTTSGCTTTTTVLHAQDDCGFPLSAAAPNPAASDCLYIGKAAVGSTVCNPECICDTDGSHTVSVSDVLLCLRDAVGAPVTLH